MNSCGTMQYYIRHFSAPFIIPSTSLKSFRPAIDKTRTNDFKSWYRGPHGASFFSKKNRAATAGLIFNQVIYGKLLRWSSVRYGARKKPSVDGFQFTGYARRALALRFSSSRVTVCNLPTGLLFRYVITRSICASFGAASGCVYFG